MSHDEQDDAAQWQKLRLTKIRDRLVEARNLLQQAAAVGLAQDVDRMETLRELHEQGSLREHQGRRRYR